MISVPAAPIAQDGGGLVLVGPFSVARGSAMLLRVVLIVALGVMTLLGLALAWVLVKQRQVAGSR